ncbi:hypothetical protein [Actinacidiphila glaucinigra]|uniref:Uncharacterized protein n=1 Tax=Actinacidiphila glaucinigra TaxID=235986 RepID=A0A239NKB4_9ACTN|nr:hypothetical protein [Actinacidiphila glaucinigra]SNT55357.1 hypothetical protein SAMN05216252_13930 [Actinacidiphila glaucinigra]
MTPRPAARARRAVAELLTRAAPCDAGADAYGPAAVTGPHTDITAKAAPLRCVGPEADKETTQ